MSLWNPFETFFSNLSAALGHIHCTSHAAAPLLAVQGCQFESILGTNTCFYLVIPSKLIPTGNPAAVYNQHAWASPAFLRAGDNSSGDQISTKAHFQKLHKWEEKIMSAAMS